MNVDDYINLVSALHRGNRTVIDLPRFLHPLRSDCPKGWKSTAKCRSEAAHMINRLLRYENGKTYAEVCYRTAVEMLEEAWAQIPSKERCEITLPVRPYNWPGSWPWNGCPANAKNFRRVCSILRKQIRTASDSVHGSFWHGGPLEWTGWLWLVLFNDIRRALTQSPDKDWYPEWWLRCRSRLAVKLGSRSR